MLMMGKLDGILHIYEQQFVDLYTVNLQFSKVNHNVSKVAH